VQKPDNWRLIESLGRESIIYTTNYYLPVSGKAEFVLPETAASARAGYDLTAFVVHDAFRAGTSPMRCAEREVMMQKILRSRRAAFCAALLAGLFCGALGALRRLGLGAHLGAFCQLSGPAGVLALNVCRRRRSVCCSGC
jgi:hypothetical protein